METVAVVSAAASAENDRAALVEFYHATGGDGWTRKDRWLTDAPIGSWHGVRVADDRVIGLDLARNNLKGRLPVVLAELTRLRWLELGHNRLWGRIPPVFGQLVELENLSLPVNELTGALPPELANLSRLRFLNLIASGTSGPIPAWLGDLVELRWLELGEDHRGGRIPRELGKLRNLQILHLSAAGLSGPIPPELGNLTSLEFLYLSRNYFASPIPPEFGNLERLEALSSWGSHLTGEIPAKMGKLPNLQRLDLSLNRLSGPVPPELGHLDRLAELILFSNALSGPIPAELGRLPRLEELYLHDNRLEGSLPGELGDLSTLRVLTLGSNPGLAGDVPREWLRLRLDQLGLAGAGVCVPDDPEFHAWLGAIGNHALDSCAAPEPVDAYLVQATQTREDPVPLVAGREALLRAFITAGNGDGATFPAVRASFYRNGGLMHVVEIPGSSHPIPSQADELDLSKSANAMIPARIVQPGIELVIEVDPLGTVDPGVDTPRRIPAEGRLPVWVEEMPTFRLTAIPWISGIDPDDSIVDLMRELSTDSPVFRETRTLLPIGDFDLTVHEPVLTTSQTGFGVLDDTEALRVLEGGEGYFLGLSAKVGPDVAGVAQLDGWSAYSVFDSGVVSHELGHTLGLGHAPCGVTGDPRFPYPDGSVGSVGYDAERRRTILPTLTKDLMSYCGPAWVADWSFRRMLLRRLSKEGADHRTALAAPPRVPALLLWGGTDAEGAPFMNPAFALEAPITLPTASGPYEIVGRSRDGQELFSLDFGMQRASSGGGRSGFAFVIPAGPGWGNALAEITLRGPGGLARLAGDTDRPSVIQRDRATGRVRAILVDIPPQALAAGAAGITSPAGALETLHSHGLPVADDWR